MLEDWVLALLRLLYDNMHQHQDRLRRHAHIYHDLIYSISDRSGIIGRRDHRDHIHDMHRLLVTNTACT